MTAVSKIKTRPDDYTPTTAPVSDMTRAKCWDMQRVVMHAVVEKPDQDGASEDERTANLAVAREILDVLGLAFHLPEPDGLEEEHDTLPLWDSSMSTLPVIEPTGLRKWTPPPVREK